jgi:hypothetical protein
MPDKKHETLTDRRSGEPLPTKDQPGYYPGFSTLGQQAYWDGATRELVLHRMEAVPVIRFFTREETLTMEAVVGRLLPQEDRTIQRRIPILPVIDERLYSNRMDGYRYEDMPPDQDAYRLGAKAIAAMAQQLHGVPFHDLGVLHQEEILRSIHDAEPQAAQDLWQQMNIERFWTMLLSDCVGAYYSHPWAWDEIGFGGPAYPRGYMRLEEGEPEPWEVNEVRYEWNAPADTLSDRAEAHGQGHEHQSQPGQGGTH